LDAETSTGQLLIESLGQSLSAYLVHRYSEHPLRTPVRRSSTKPIDNRRMSRILEFIEAHLGESFTVADLASVACMSHAHFARSFKATTGQAPHAYISKMRLELTKRMLADGHQPMTEIAFSAGFSSHSNFSRAFRNATGMTPSDYRLGQTAPRALNA
jgi:AraC family transcriptional regulator